MAFLQNIHCSAYGLAFSHPLGSWSHTVSWGLGTAILILMYLTLHCFSPSGREPDRCSFSSELVTKKEHCFLESKGTRMKEIKLNASSLQLEVQPMDPLHGQHLGMC